MEELWRENNIFYNVLCFLITENEKLFDRNDANLYWRTVFHLFSILHHLYIVVIAPTLHIENNPNPDINILYKYKEAFLTGWNFAFQIVFLGLSLSHDVLEWLDMNDGRLATRVKYWRDVVFAGMVVPYTLFVTSMFWTVYTIDRELVFPKVYDSVVPWWFNHCVHTNITVVVIIETLLQARRKPIDPKVELIFCWFIAFSYAIVYYAIYFVTGRWLYQVFGVMNWWQICLYQLLIWGSSYVFYLIQYPINRLIHGSVDESDSNHDKPIENLQTDEKISSNENDNDTSKNAWSLKFRNLKNNLENSRL